MIEKPTVRVLSTGGTIASLPDIDGFLSGRELIDEVPEVEQVANIEVKDVAASGSS